jgi:NAD(P)-dependent dehydrogenase (short-subunit alcohol dehydrogenase family)
LLDHNQNKLDSLVRDLNLPDDRLFASVVDLRDKQAVRDSAEAASNKLGSIHALIHLVGGWTGGKTLTEVSEDDLTSMLDQHVWTTFHLFQAFAPKLAASGWGRVITISPSTVSNPPAERGVYTAAKAAQENLVLTLAAELKESGVTANIIQVKAIDVKNEGKGTTPDEIVAAMMYLFSEEANKISGARIPVY